MLRSWSCARAFMGFLYMCTVDLQLKIIWDVVGVFVLLQLRLFVFPLDDNMLSKLTGQ